LAFGVFLKDAIALVLFHTGIVIFRFAFSEGGVGSLSSSRSADGASYP
tara:strand:+ start:470 stop:613 length:144 start_codon:yes stop_codon:yes gene_type:complete